MPLNWREKVILAKTETTYSTDAAPTGAANAILMTEVSFSPMEGEDVSRNLDRSFLGAQEELPAALRGVLTGSTEWVGSGTLGTAPAWGVLARACGMAQTVTAGTSVVYSPVSSGHESLTIYFWVGLTKHVLTGARGTGVLSLNAQGIPVIKWTLTGLWAIPTETARQVPTLTPWQKPRIASKANTPTFTVGGTALVMRSFEVDFGCDVQPRMLIPSEEILIVDRKEEIRTTVEAVPLGTFNPYQRANDLTATAVVIEHGTVAATRVKFNAATCQVKRLAGYENQQNIAEWPLRLAPLPTSGNDQWTMTLS